MTVPDRDPIVEHSARRAAEAAAVIWAMASAQYPFGGSIVLDVIQDAMIDTVTTFAVNARRAMAALGERSYPLTPRRTFVGRTGPFPDSAEPVTELIVALHRIVHATRLDVPFWYDDDGPPPIDETALVITTLLIETDRWALAWVDPFSMASAYLRGPWLDLGGRP